MTVRYDETVVVVGLAVKLAVCHCEVQRLFLNSRVVEDSLVSLSSLFSIF